ncbi:MAG TPA: hypothetical protein VFW24_18310 [Acidimicrobiales bacterium]|nr:hypothetical protein [Acidimicrobiales bacterium]
MPRCFTRVKMPSNSSSLTRKGVRGAHRIHQQEGQPNDNGRGFYFEDPSGHNMEVLTHPYGS